LSFNFLAFSAIAVLDRWYKLPFFPFRKDVFQVKETSLDKRWEGIQKNRKRKVYYFKKKSA